ncbi:ABC transporter ATP-binding protein [Actinoplanes derwentensis]|uniref:Energy-coupling factor transport system ATP-binding protein n=1 Tax=Actinoplanes derwentensis TaxID=113562 RepID=A0A1H2CXF4_9ACTN|nr:ABC transporter ATP-binding protein [Actinoplanes derwentensis]SDT74892.1 energy-coupling factor transport system ATP-binding protein [Actinoplanes derwentensis]
MSDVLLRLTGVSVRHEVYDESGSMSHGVPRPVEVSAELRAGEVVLLLGPSGCGKSTLTLTANGLIPHVIGAEMDGTVTVAGTCTAASTVPELARDVAMVFQDPDAQIVTASLLDEVCFGPENLLVPVAEVLERAEEALRLVGLWDRRHDDPDILSGGGRQRLAIACALALRTPVLVLDEPTANLDPAGVEEVYRTLRAVAAGRDRAVLLVEHNLDAAIDFVDRVIVLDGAGRVVLDGPARAILTDHVDELLELGVWLPVATLAALRLRTAGVVLEPLPLTPAELATALDAVPVLPALRDNPRSTSRSETAISVRGLTVTRGRTAVLHDITVDIGAGEFVAMAGANGAGKTTLAQALAGVIPSRRVTITGPAGFVFQNPEHQFLTNRVDDELAYGTTAAARVEELLDRLDLRDLRAVHPFLLSGGQKRRLSVGAALVTRPRVLVLDEPTFGQDRARAAELLDLLGELHRDGTTVVVVSHDMHLIAEYATRLLVLDDGRVIADGTPAEIYTDTALLTRTGLCPPPLARAARTLARHPAWHTVTRLADLPALEPSR